MKKLNYMAVITAGIMSACSPKVTTEMMTQSFTPQPTNKVMIYGTRDKVPEASRAIGQVQVDTRQASMKKQYTKALNLAVKETAQHGGNVLVVDHSELDKNLLKGTIAYLDGKVADSLTISPTRIKQLQAMTGKQNKSTIKQMENHEQQAIAQRQEEVRQQEIEKLQSLTEPEEENNETWETKEIASGEAASYFDLDNNEKKTGQGIITVSAGPMWTVSKIYISDRDYRKSTKGFAINASFTKMFKNWGVGIEGSHFKADQEDVKYAITYIGPSVMYGGNISEKIWGHISLGLGYSSCHEDYNNRTLSGLGIRESVGIEYMISKSCGLGIDLTRHVSIFKPAEADAFTSKTGESYGYDNIGIIGTLSIHL